MAGQRLRVWIAHHYCANRIILSEAIWTQHKGCAPSSISRHKDQRGHLANAISNGFTVYYSSLFGGLSSTTGKRDERRGQCSKGKIFLKHKEVSLNLRVLEIR